MNSWQKVYQDKMEYRAQIVRDVLDDHHFNPVIVSKKDSAYHFGHFEVRVAPEYVIRALKIVDEEIQWSP